MMSLGVQRVQGLVPSRRAALVGLGLLVLVLLVRLNVAIIGEDAQTRDAAQNVRFGYAFADDGTFSTVRDDPTMYREPLPIAAIALQLRIDPRLADVTLRELSRDGPAIRALKQQNLLWAGLLLAGVALQTWRLSTRRRALLAGAAVVAVHAVFIETVADRMLSELPSAAFIVWAGLFAQQALSTRRLLPAVTLGALIGLAALTKASMLYIGLVYVLLLAVLLVLSGRRSLREVGVGALAVLVALSAVVGPWMARNAQNFGAASIADRGGLSLWYRAIYEQASPEELRGSWYEFTPLPLRPVAGAILGVAPEDLDGPLRRVARFHPDESEEQRSFYSLARVDRVTLSEEYLEAGIETRDQARVLADQDLIRQGLEVLQRDPLLFLRTTPMFLWRGSWPILAAPLVPQPLLGLINPAAMGALLLVGVGSVLRRRPERFAVVGLPLGVVAFSALLTMYEPRFTEPALPMMLILLVLATDRVVDRVAGRVAERRAR